MRKIAVLLFIIIDLVSYSISKAQDFSIEEHKVFDQNKEFVWRSRFSPLGTYLAVSVGRNALDLYDRRLNKVWSHKTRLSFPAVEGHLISFSPDEKYLAFTKNKSTEEIAIVRLSDKKTIQEITDISEPITDFTFSPDGKYVVAAAGYSVLYYWKWNGNKYADKQTIRGPIFKIAFTNDDLLITMATNALIKVYQNSEGKFKEIQSIGPTAKEGFTSNSIAVHPAGKYFVIGGQDSQENEQYLKLYRRTDNTFNEEKDIVKKHGVINCIAFSPDGNYLGVGRYNSKIDIWKEGDNNFSEVRTITHHKDHIYDLNFSNDGKYLVTSSFDFSFIVWKLQGIKAQVPPLFQELAGEELTNAQKRVLTREITDRIISNLDKTLVAEKDEFESNADYQNRKERLKAQVLRLLQNELETFYGVKLHKKETAKSILQVKIDRLEKYDAERQTYSLSFMETPATVAIPPSDAKNFKNAWEKGLIQIVKEDNNNENIYKGFELIHPSNGKSYKVNVEQNPFAWSKQKVKPEEKQMVMRVAGNEGVKESNDVEDPAKYLKKTKGKNYALFFATNDYDHYQDLTNPVNDAKTISKELKEHYDFEVEVVENPSLNDLISTLRLYAQKKFEQKDQLFIFVAGHGIYDDIFKEGYVVAKSSVMNDETKTTLLSHSNLRTIVNNIPCDHIFLAMDVCFGGTFDPLIASRGQENSNHVTKSEFIERKLAHKTRIYLTSGGKEYVPDGRPGEHSPFARKVLEALRSYGGEDGVLTFGEVFNYVDRIVPQPRAGEFGNNEPGSDFIFVAK